jgi:hypothetical protein
MSRAKKRSFPYLDSVFSREHDIYGDRKPVDIILFEIMYKEKITRRMKPNEIETQYDDYLKEFDSIKKEQKFRREREHTLKLEEQNPTSSEERFKNVEKLYEREPEPALKKPIFETPDEGSSDKPEPIFITPTDKGITRQEPSTSDYKTAARISSSAFNEAVERESPRSPTPIRFSLTGSVEEDKVAEDKPKRGDEVEKPEPSTNLPLKADPNPFAPLASPSSSDSSSEYSVPLSTVSQESDQGLTASDQGLTASDEGLVASDESVPYRPVRVNNLPNQENQPDNDVSKVKNVEEYAVDAAGTIKNAVHPVSLQLFFGSSTKPNWDLDLEKSIDELKLSTKEINEHIDMILAASGNKLLINKRKLSGSKQEFKEVVELHFCLERHMSKGTRANMAIIPVDKLLEMRNNLANAAGQTPPQVTEPTAPVITDDTSPFDPAIIGDDGSVNVEEIVPPSQTITVDVKSNQPVQKQIEQNKEDARLEMAIRTRTVDFNGKPIILPDLRSIIRFKGVPEVLPTQPGVVNEHFDLTYAQKDNYVFRFKEQECM